MIVDSSGHEVESFLILKEVADRRDASEVTAKQQGVPLHGPDCSLGLALEAFPPPQIFF